MNIVSPSPVYQRLQQFPLFQGMSIGELTKVLAHTKFGFEKFEPQRRVVKAGEACHHLFFLTNGDLMIETVSHDGLLRVEEYISAPAILQPECIFGLPQRFRSTYTSVTPVNFITLEKKEVLVLCERFQVFQLNLMNMMSKQSQQLLLAPWKWYPTTLREHIVHFLMSHSQILSGCKNYYILMRHLAEAVNDSRLDVSRQLRAMEEDGQLRLTRGKIQLVDMQQLIQLYVAEEKRE